MAIKISENQKTIAAGAGGIGAVQLYSVMSYVCTSKLGWPVEVCDGLSWFVASIIGALLPAVLTRLASGK